MLQGASRASHCVKTSAGETRGFLFAFADGGKSFQIDIAAGDQDANALDGRRKLAVKRCGSGNSAAGFDNHLETRQQKAHSCFDLLFRNQQDIVHKFLHDRKRDIAWLQGSESVRNGFGLWDLDLVAGAKRQSPIVRNFRLSAEYFDVRID